jgi:hypothetical protein
VSPYRPCDVTDRSHTKLSTCALRSPPRCTYSLQSRENTAGQGQGGLAHCDHCRSHVTSQSHTYHTLNSTVPDATRGARVTDSKLQVSTAMCDLFAISQSCARDILSRGRQSSVGIDARVQQRREPAPHQLVIHPLGCHHLASAASSSHRGWRSWLAIRLR